MASHIFSASHYLNQWWNIVNWTLRNKFQWNFNQNLNIFVQEYAFEDIVCKMVDILSRPQWVNRRNRGSSSGGQHPNSNIPKWRTWWYDYHQISNIRRTKSQNLNVSRLVLQLPLPIHWSQVLLLSREWRCSWSSADRRCSNYNVHLSDQQFYHLGAFILEAWW